MLVNGKKGGITNWVWNKDIYDGCRCRYWFIKGIKSNNRWAPYFRWMLTLSIATHRAYTKLEKNMAWQIHKEK